MAVHLPGVPNLDAATIKPRVGLKDSTAKLGDIQALDRSYEEDGYLFFRGLIPREAAEAARLKMAKVLFEQGLISGTDRDAAWVGGDKPNISEESPLYAGTCKGVFDWPGVADTFAKLLGEPAEMIPMVQYRAYKPNGALGGVHQDGYSSPGIIGYRPIWLALSDIDEEIGGLVLAAGHNQRGILHNLAQERPYVATGLVPEDEWITENYRQGDVVVLHPLTPHVGLPNRSKRIRYSLDTRVQSAAKAMVVSGELAGRDLDSVTIKRDNGELIRLSVDDETFIRVHSYGRRMTRQDMVDKIQLGARVMASRDGDRAVMVRHAFAG